MPDSAAIAAVIDGEVRALVQQAFDRALAILTERRHALVTGARLLLEKETIEEADLQKLVAPNALAAE